MRPYLEKTLHKKGLEEWLKVKAPSSSPSIAKTKTNKKEPVSILLSTLCRVLTCNHKSISMEWLKTYLCSYVSL
jgi:hypothetical protein